MSGLHSHRLVLLSLFLACGRVGAQSFDCTKATTRVERAICASKEVSELDATLAQTLKGILARTPERRKALLSDERRWISLRDQKCGPPAAGPSVTECLVETYDSRIAELTRAPEAPAAKLAPACTEAEQRLNDWLKQGIEATRIFPAATANTIGAEALPTGTGLDSAGNAWNILISDARVGGTALKAISYHEGGACRDQVIELWDPAYKHRVTIPTSELDPDTNSPSDPGDDSSYSSEELALLNGRPYFAHITRSGKYAKLYELNHDMTARPVCEIARTQVEQESIDFAADTAVCTAVLKDNSDAGILTETQDSDLSDKVAAKVLGDLVWGRDGPLSIIARGQADLYNEGHPHLVGMLAYHHSDGAGCGHEWGLQWPVILGEDGMPVEPARKDVAFEQAGETSRLLRYAGTTYYETRTADPLDGLPRHEVWKLTSSGATKVCTFNIARYRAHPVTSP